MGLLPDTQICGCACAGNAGNVFPVTAGKRSRHASRHVRHARAVMHAGIANQRFPLKSAAGENVPGIPGACATCNFTYLVRGPWRWALGEILTTVTDTQDAIRMPIYGTGICRQKNHTIALVPEWWCVRPVELLHTELLFWEDEPTSSQGTNMLSTYQLPPNVVYLLVVTRYLCWLSRYIWH